MTESFRIIFTPSGKRGSFPVGTPILNAARSLGVDLDSVCGGHGICSKCQVTPSFGTFPKHGLEVSTAAISEINAVEARYDRVRGLAPGRRLGCQATLQGDLIVDVPAESQVHRQVVRKRAEMRDIILDPATRLYYVEVTPPDMENPLGDLERLKAALREDWGLKDIALHPRQFRKLQATLRQGEWRVTCAVHCTEENGPAKILDIWPGYFEGPIYGLAIDLGSTTIAAHLCNLISGEVVASAGQMNPQIRYGEDLMSRVSYAMMNPGGDLEMTRAVRTGINELIKEVVAEADLSSDHILETVFVANPVMHHLLLGIDPSELGQAPFALAMSDAMTMDAADLELDLNGSAQVYILPCIAGHVGADAAAVALSEAPHQSDDLVLIVDVGTNAELLLGNKNKVLACSSPTGPAFEGAQISAGQRAAPGAIERVEINAETLVPRFRVIGSDLWSDDPKFPHDMNITGICGSGIIEAIAEMRMAGIVDASGLIGSAAQVGSERCRADGRTHAYLLHDGSAAGGPTILVTQSDVRAIQLAKSALYAGARLLMDKMGVEKVDRVVLAGAFGAHISPKHALVLGMIPDCASTQVTSAGNAAGTGARIALLNRSARRDIEAIVQQIEKVETAIEPRFQEHFVAANHIPHMTAKFACLRKEVTLPSPTFNAEKRRRRKR